LDRILWEVQTLAANLDAEQLLEVRDELRARIGSDFADEVLEQWEHELEDD
jgi:hypothetical protein